MAFIGPKTEKQFVLSINQEHNDVHINMKNGHEAEETLLLYFCQDNEDRLPRIDQGRLFTIRLFADHLRAIYLNRNPFRSNRPQPALQF
ncbi:unnamed protein product [Adineta steineri]|uniref:Uncharacterized protein n=1 Tax=Adineta steineri TaxID=433720 RepID=A0A818S1C3_9BILA|nr:unnamed protein product [Adineta steineri]CAF3661916.1 unnamed protein product [Adineta steineri]